jgi:hypothetical protein
MRSRQLVENFFLDNSAQLESDFGKANQAFSSSGHRATEKHFGVLDGEDIGG